jgi:valacyclovir hydrolase
LKIKIISGALGSCWTDFKPQIEKLPKLIPDYNVIAWDPPGYGRSIPPSRNFTLDFLEKDADYVEKLMKTLGCQKYSVIGWSDGGITGLICAGKYQESVENLVIFGSNAYIVEKELQIYKSIRDVEKWSPRMREPMEKLYGPEKFKSLWESWVDTFVKIYQERLV